MAIIVLAVAGLCFGSFVNALVWRLHQQEPRAKNQKPKTKKSKLSAKDFQLRTQQNLSILRGRSICPKCGHELAIPDLVPVFSWLILRGHCRYCKKPISRQYPVVEVVMTAVFAASYYWWPGGVNTGADWLVLATWLAASVGLLALAVYDFKWMLLPNKILYPTAAVAFGGKLAEILLFSENKAHSWGLLALSLFVASGIFWVLFEISKGKWIGFGDVRLGLITGTLLATPVKSLLMIFLASFLGVVASLPALAGSRAKFLKHRLPYGPFLITATAVLVLFGDGIINWYKALTGY